MDIEEGDYKEATTGERKFLKRCKKFSCRFTCACFIAGFIVGIVWLFIVTSRKVPKIKLASMDFTVFNITDTRLSAKWDLSIRIPDDLPGHYICLQGDFQASFMYKNVTLAISSPQKYIDFKYGEPQVLKVSASISGEDIDGLIGKDITEDMKEKKEVRLGTRFYLTDCRKKTTGTMRYACDEVALRFEPGSEMKAALFGKSPSCVYYRPKSTSSPV